MKIRLAVLLRILAATSVCAFAWRPPAMSLDQLASTDPDIALPANRQVYDKPDEYFAVLVEGLRHPAARVRATCCHHLGLMRASLATADIERLLNDPEHKVRVQAAQALAKVRNWTDPAAIVRFVADPSQPSAGRESLARALGRRKQSSGRDVLVRIAADKSSGAILREAAADALGCMPADASLLAVLKAVALDDTAPIEVRLKTACSIGRLRLPDGFAFLQSVLADGGKNERLRGSSAVGLSYGGAGQKALLQKFAEDGGAPMVVRVQAVFATFLLGEVLPHEFLQQALKDPTWYVREAAVHTIMRLDDTEMIEAIEVAAAKETNSCVKCAMKHALCRLKPRAEAELQEEN